MDTRSPIRCIAALWRDGCDTAEIARALGVPESYVWNRFSQAMERYPWAKRKAPLPMTFHVKQARS